MSTRAERRMAEEQYLAVTMAMEGEEVAGAASSTFSGRFAAATQEFEASQPPREWAVVGVGWTTARSRSSHWTRYALTEDVLRSGIREGWRAEPKLARRQFWRAKAGTGTGNCERLERQVHRNGSLIGWRLCRVSVKST